MKRILTLILALCLMLSAFALADASDASLVVAVDADYNGLHPANWYTTVEQRLNSQIYDTLLRKNYEDPSVLEPRVAESWTVSEDGTCYTFKLRDDVTFHNGEKLTAADIEFTFETFAASEYQGAVVDGYSHCVIVDDTTIEVHTVSPYAPFLASLDQMFIASKNYYETAGEEAFAQAPIGCGPYKWASHNEGDKVTLEAYEGYYRGPASIKTVTFKVISDVSSMGIGLRTGELDFAEVEPSILSTLQKADGVSIAEADQTTFGFITMNIEKEPYNNVKFRQAVNYAIDRQSIIIAVLEGAATENSNLLTPDRMGWSESQKQYSYDPEMAKALIAECGITTPYDLGTMIISEQYKLMAQVVQANLEAVGLTCKIEVMEANAYYERLMGGDFGLTCLQMSLEGDTQQVSLALCPEYIGMANNARYNNPEIAELFATAVITVDDAERAAIYEQIFTIVQEEAVYAILYNPTMFYAYDSNLKLHTLPLEGQYDIYNFAW
ncbi:MAG: ABC transporter substrate-binding protein [Clostridia bacterium]|nr:ABC transporter substrate-binding protein [Clostridia bacterium]